MTTLTTDNAATYLHSNNVGHLLADAAVALSAASVTKHIPSLTATSARIRELLADILIAVGELSDGEITLVPALGPKKVWDGYITVGQNQATFSVTLAADGVVVFDEGDLPYDIVQNNVTLLLGQTFSTQDAVVITNLYQIFTYLYTVLAYNRNFTKRETKNVIKTIHPQFVQTRSTLGGILGIRAEQKV